MSFKHVMKLDDRCWPIGAPVFLLAGGLWLGAPACTQSMPSHGARLTADATVANDVNLGLADDTDSDKSAILVASVRDLTGVIVCLGAPAACDAGTADKLETKSVTLQGGGKGFATAAAIALVDGMHLTVQARDPAGAAVVREVLIRRKSTVGSGAAANLSQGHGGALGFHEASFRASNGKTANFKLDVPKTNDAQHAQGLLVYLHGDGGADYDWYYANLAAVAAKHDLIPVAVMSPTANENGPSWWWDADPNAAFLDELLKEEVLAKYNVDKFRVVFTGASGGPTFMNGPWLRHYASQYRGGAMVFCGGLVQTSTAFVGDADFKAHFPLYYYVGTADFLLPGAQSAIAYYKSQGLKVESEFPAGVGHCQFTDRLPALMDERLTKILGPAAAAALALHGDDTTTFGAAEGELSRMQPDEIEMDVTGALRGPKH